MEQSKALHQLTEAADLLAMIDTLTSPEVMQRGSSSASWAGLRIALRNAREMVLGSHNCLAAGLVANARAKMEAKSQATEIITTDENGASAQRAATIASAKPAIQSPINGVKMDRKDLRAQLEKIIDR